MSDFSPETRNSAIWSGDTRKVMAGRANDVVLTKLGQMPIPDLSQVEAVQMGHVMEPIIGRLASQRLGIDLQKIDSASTHPKHAWFKSHFDYVGEENGETILVECKNYNAQVRNKFDVENGVMPQPDLGQLIHEAAVYGVRKTYLAVLFGGQELAIIPRTITDTEKDELIQTMAKVWAAVQTKTPLAPETVDQVKILFPTSREAVKTASGTIEEACTTLSTIKGQIKALEAQEEVLQTSIQAYMAETDTLQSFDGRVLATWKSAKGSRKFDSALFKQAMPDIYEQFMADVPGSRRFLIK